MTELRDLLEMRRSTRRFDPGRDVSPEVLASVLRAPLAMPHAGNTYDWRTVVLLRRTRDPSRWPAIYEAMLSQSYLEEAAAVLVWTVRPAWWEANYRRNVDDLVQRGLIDAARHGALLELIAAGPGGEFSLPSALAGEAMMGVAAAMLAAMDAGLGATITACRPARLAAALGVPADAVVLPFGVLAIGHPAEAAAGRPAKPAFTDLYYLNQWGQELTLPLATESPTAQS
jgi:nitroreductase